MSSYSLLGVANAKTEKGESLGYKTGILYLAPAFLANATKNVCPWKSAGCELACLNTAGRGKFDAIQEARIRKTREFWANPKAFVEELANDIEALVRHAEREGMTPCVRLNGTSDLPWESLGGHAGVSLMNRFPGITFYDYTKGASRVRSFLAGKMPANYSLTFSRSECNGETALELIRAGASVACVFSTKKADVLPKRYLGRTVIDGDAHDLRFLDKAGSVVGLRAKGDARKDTSGFVVHV